MRCHIAILFRLSSTVVEHHRLLSEWARPELTVFELRDTGYVRAAISTQPLTLSRPFTVTVTPADLTKGLLR
jgi:hypothetical protein